jgi:hypothetical protein
VSPALLIPVVASSCSSLVWAITLMVTHLSRQRTERIKHSRAVDLEREFLNLAMATYKDSLAKGQAVDLVDVMLTLRGAMTGQRTEVHGLDGSAKQSPLDASLGQRKRASAGRPLSPLAR